MSRRPIPPAPAPGSAASNGLGSRLGLPALRAICWKIGGGRFAGAGAGAYGPGVSAAVPTAAAAPALRLTGLRKASAPFGDFVAVHDVSLEVRPGEVFGLLGPNGAGKSTTMMIACGVLAADAGTVELGGERLTPTARKLRGRLGVVPQDLAIYPELTARQNLRFFGRLYGLRGRELDDRVADALDRTGLTGRADDKSDEYSGGMKRRLNFGCALMHRPAVLILDEPTVGVDPQSRSHLLNSVRDSETPRGGRR